MVWSEGRRGLQGELVAGPTPPSKTPLRPRRAVWNAPVRPSPRPTRWLLPSPLCPAPPPPRAWLPPRPRLPAARPPRAQSAPLAALPSSPTLKSPASASAATTRSCARPRSPPKFPGASPSHMRIICAIAVSRVRGPSHVVVVVDVRESTSVMKG